MAAKRPRVSNAKLDAMIEDAVVDAYDDAEQIMGLVTMIDEHLDLPFGVTVLGVAATVEEIGQNDAGEVVAVCHRGKKRQQISLVDLELPSPPPTGWEWTEAYRQWARARR